MVKSNTTQAKVDKEFSRFIKDSMKIRLSKGLAKFNIRDLSTAEGTRLLMRCPSFPNIKNEIRTLPKGRRNGK